MTLPSCFNLLFDAKMEACQQCLLNDECRAKTYVKQNSLPDCFGSMFDTSEPTCQHCLLNDHCRLIDENHQEKTNGHIDHEAV
jgi:hypothetical protein